MSCGQPLFTTLATADSSVSETVLLTDDLVFTQAVLLADGTKFDVLLTAPVQLQAVSAAGTVPVTLTVSRRGAVEPLFSQTLSTSVSNLGVAFAVITPSLGVELGQGHYVFTVTVGATAGVSAQVTLNSLIVAKYVV
jgi:hypothetical protein